MAEIGIVIVTYNSESEIGECLDAALATGAEIVVVDNASSDGSPELVRQDFGWSPGTTNAGGRKAGGGTGSQAGSSPHPAPTRSPATNSSRKGGAAHGDHEGI